MAAPRVHNAPIDEPIGLFDPDFIKRFKLDPKQVGVEINPRWFDYIDQDIKARLNVAPAQTGGIVVKEGLTAAQPVTPIQMPSFGKGRMRVNVHVKVRQAAGLNSQILVTIGYTNNGVACSLSTTNLTTNTTASVESMVKTLKMDANSPITWSSTYVSAGAPVMSYDVDIEVEALP